ncbi:hypothetical protein PVAG01_03960 [Phlyctema vagabunda]|uniref:Uncharacterized protein n=1 Tax=Phlyctema vagabunda TaxID=108571 RepID=A0ABR4PMY0_9HELO
MALGAALAYMKICTASIGLWRLQGAQLRSTVQEEHFDKGYSKLLLERRSIRPQRQMAEMIQWVIMVVVVLRPEDRSGTDTVHVESIVTDAMRVMQLPAALPVETASVLYVPCKRYEPTASATVRADIIGQNMYGMSSERQSRLQYNYKLDDLPSGDQAEGASETKGLARMIVARRYSCCTRSNILRQGRERAQIEQRINEIFSPTT